MSIFDRIQESFTHSGKSSGSSHKTRVLFVTPEASPFVKTGGLAEVAHFLPSSLLKLGCEVRVILPYYRAIAAQKFNLKEEIRGLPIPMGMGEMQADLYSARLSETSALTYFVKNDRYFDRDGFYASSEGDYLDNAERFAFFSRAVLEVLKAINWFPQILHLNDWQSSLVAAYLKSLYRENPAYSRIHTLLSVHNMAYQGVFPKYVLPMTGLPWEEFRPDRLEFYDQVNFLKAGLVYADSLTTVSEAYAREIQTEEQGHGLQGVLRDRSADLHGIIHGLDYGEWNPATDKDLPAQYTAKNHHPKVESKRRLVKEQDLEFKPQTPLVGMVSYLTDAKGLDLVAECLGEWMEMDAQFIIMGTGEGRYQALLQEWHERYPRKLVAIFKYDHRLAKLLYAGSDLFLMPSRFEPSGLGQLIAMKYGAVPVVRRTGGLSDTVENLALDGRSGTGFVFENLKHNEFLGALRRALEAYHQSKLWSDLMERGMKRDFSWDATARQYLALYETLIKA
jgi:starch synthase